MTTHPNGGSQIPSAASSLPVGFQVIHANRLEDLRSLVVEVIRSYPLGPLDDEVFLVHSNGIAQWLKLALARNEDDEELAGLGIAAAMQFSLPSRFLWQAYRAVLGENQVATQSPYDKDQLVWRLYRLLPDLTGDAVFEPLARFLAGEESDRRHYQLAERIADLFDQYQVYRADWLEDWRQQRDIIRVRGSQERPLPPEQQWQAELWRRVVADIEAQSGVMGGDSRADIHHRFMGAASGLSAANRPHGLPKRLIVFGVSSLPQQTLEVLSRLGQCMQVLLCIHNPCRYYWADIVEDRDLLRAASKRGARRSGMPEVLDEGNLHLHAQPLLAAWGKQGRDYIRLLDEYDDQDSYRHRFEAIDLFRSPWDGSGEGNGDRKADAGSCLLAAIQDDILNLRPVDEATRPLSLADMDDSVVFHSCHSAQREVEVLHDQLLAVFESDPSLRPQDVIVMVPDIDSYAPHIQAVFGQLESTDERFIPFTVSDQGQRHKLPALIALEKLLSLTESRIAVSDVLDMLDVPALRARFGLGEDDLPQLHQWIQGANIRWGLDGEHRASQDLPAGMEQNTWLFGLRRMLLGYAVGDGDAWQGIEPYGEVGGLESRVAGQLEQFLRYLSELWQALQEPRVPQQWAGLLTVIRQGFFANMSEDDVLVFTQLEQVVDQWLAACLASGLELTPLPLGIVREVWLSGLETGGLSQRFMAGKVNFATLMPMRAIPFKHICLLGMNDGDYPRSQAPVDFDLMAEDYRPGDRSRREDDRYLFLEALLSARKQMYISWIGRSVKDNSERPPSVLVAQLQDHIDLIRPLRVDDAVQVENVPTLSQYLTTEHPLQPFSPLYFPSNGRSQPAGRLFTFAHEWREAHEGRDREPTDSTNLMGVLPAGLLDEPLTLTGLTRFLRSPVDSFFQQRLGIRFSELDEPLSDDEPFALDGLERWHLTDELIRRVIIEAGEGPGFGPDDLEDRLNQIIRRQAARGEFPPGGVGQVIQQRLRQDLPELYQRYQERQAAFPDEVDLQLFRFEREVAGHPIVIEDWIGGLRASAAGGRACITVSSSNLVDGRKRYRWTPALAAWVKHLAACLVGAEPLSTSLLSKVGIMEFPPLSAKDAETHLGALLEAWVAGLKAPLAVAPNAAFAWLTYVEKGEERALSAAREAYEGGFNTRGESDQKPALRRAYPSFDDLIADGQFQHWVDALYRPLWQAVKQEGGA
ncbi:exodeoxyribonuclease V subunit gamma [Marinobacter zhejiangensis]|uniref:RecBCD enzyme subunit RecC n=1 Tax=Marinobacter zhejiangensis TaxID=488535 RepID=A0A1I4PD76_9GAMM|nr:exodeoxyribonuclease V subunit gamma [Marinobacter zhejiangensis]SFM25650.1 DNA helicase/exodeoxyribonuclease V, gamma subunit [Marinobacter zhejiangensis]